MPFDTLDRTAPHDLVFWYVMRRKYLDPKNPGQWKLSEKPGNAYFHARDLACLRCVPELCNINETHIYIEDGIYHSLMADHLELLERRGHVSALKKTEADLMKKSKK